jgi:hypothetical protein
MQSLPSLLDQQFSQAVCRFIFDVTDEKERKKGKDRKRKEEQHDIYSQELQ